MKILEGTVHKKKVVVGEYYWCQNWRTLHCTLELIPNEIEYCVGSDKTSIFTKSILIHIHAIPLQMSLFRITFRKNNTILEELLEVGNSITKQSLSQNIAVSSASFKHQCYLIGVVSILWLWEVTKLCPQ